MEIDPRFPAAHYEHDLLQEAASDQKQTTVGGDVVAPGPDESMVMGYDLPDWPADLKTFAERKAYQRGVADTRAAANGRCPRTGVPFTCGAYPTCISYYIVGELNTRYTPGKGCPCAEPATQERKS